jgi:hypothetical protein
VQFSPPFLCNSKPPLTVARPAAIGAGLRLLFNPLAVEQAKALAATMEAHHAQARRRIRPIAMRPE